MVSGWSAPVTIGRLVSQCAEAMRIAFGLPRRLPSAAHARPAAPASRACIGEPWLMNTLGSGTMDLCAPRRLLGDQAFSLHRFLHLGPRRDALSVLLQVRPLGKIDLCRLGPVREHEQIRIGYREG